MNYAENVYNIEDLYIVTLKEDFIKHSKEEEYIESFNQNLSFIAERFYIEKGNGLPYFFEAYTECMTGVDLSKREGEEPFQEIPSTFLEVEKFPVDYLDEEERKTGKIKTVHLFQIFVEMNMKSKQLRK